MLISVVAPVINTCLFILIKHWLTDICTLVLTYYYMYVYIITL